MIRLKQSRPSRVVAAVLLLAALWSSPHGRQDDGACLPSFTSEHDASKHAIAEFDAVAHGHCAVCHWLRALKPSFAAAFGGAVELPVSASVAGFTGVVHPVSNAAPLPARAPPSLL